MQVLGLLVLVAVLSGCATRLPDEVSVGRFGTPATPEPTGGMTAASSCPPDARALLLGTLEEIREDDVVEFRVEEVELAAVGPDLELWTEDAVDATLSTVGVVLADTIGTDYCALEYAVDEGDIIHKVYLPPSRPWTEVIGSALVEQGWWEQERDPSSDDILYTDDHYLVMSEEVDAGGVVSSTGFGVELDPRYSAGVAVVTVVWGG